MRMLCGAQEQFARLRRDPAGIVYGCGQPPVLLAAYPGFGDPIHGSGLVLNDQGNRGMELSRAQQEEIHWLWRGQGFSARATFALTQLGLRSYNEVAEANLKALALLPYVGARTIAEIERRLGDWKRTGMAGMQTSRHVTVSAEL